MRCIARLFSIAFLVVLNIACFQNAFAQALKADYQFQNNRSSSVSGAPDLVDLVRVGQSCPAYCNAFTTDSVKGESRVVLHFPQDNGLELQPTTSVLTDNGIYTIAILFKVDTPNIWRRIVDLEHGTSDTGLYVAPNNSLNFYNFASGPANAIVAGNYAQVVLTRDGAGLVKGYVNGVEQFQFSDTLNYAVIDSSNILRFFQDNTSGGVPGEASSGAVARIRIFDGAMTASQVSALECLPPPGGMVAWWPGEGNANDIRGENNGTLVGGVTFPSGEVGQAFGLKRSSSQYVNVADSPSLRPTNITIDGWFNFASNPGDQHLVAKAAGTGPFDSYVLYFQGGVLRAGIGDASGVDSVASTFSPTLNTWYHIAFTFDDSTNTETLYVNGAVVQSGATNRSIGYDAHAVLIGAESENEIISLFYDGQIDEVEVLNRALAQTEIQSIAEAGPEGKCRPRCTQPPPGMVSWWDGDDDPFDRQGTNHGAFIGTPAYGTGKVGRAFSFDGSGTSVFVADSPSLRVTSQLTLDAWVNSADFSNFPMIVSKFNGGHNSYELHLQPDGSVRANVSADGTTLDLLVSSAGVVSTGAWFHVTTTFNAGDWRIYVNGVQVASKTSPVMSIFTADQNGAAADLLIGRDTTTAHNFNGLIDEVEVFSTALSASDIQAINNAGFAGKCKLCLSPPDNMVGWWDGDANTRDDSGNGNAGSLTGGTTFAFGRVGQAFNLNANADSGVVIRSSPSLNPTEAITIDAWVNPSSYPNSGPAVVRKDTNTVGTTQYSLNVGDGVTTGVAHCNIGGTIGATGGSVPLKQWSHLACTYDRQNLRVYVNGVEVASAAGTTAIPTAVTTNLAIGKEDSFTDRNFDGLIDEVEIFTRALTQTEIQSLVAAGVSGKCKRAATATGVNVSNQVGDATVTFNNVSGVGTTTYQTLPLYQAGPMPFGFNSPLHIAHISTTATFNGDVNVCFNLQAINDNNTFNQLRILHQEGNDLINRTSSSNFATRTLCATSPSLSPFVITQGPNLPTAAPATISGTVTTAGGTPLAGVTVSLSGASSARTITDINGNYQFNNVDTEKFYTVTPSRLNYHFSPAERSFSLLGNQTDAVFTADPNSVIVGNAIDSADYFVRQHYVDFLGREPDEAGFNFWSEQIASCGTDAACVEVKRINVSAAYFLSIEFQQTGGLVDGLYRTSYGRRPLYTEFMPDTARMAENVVVGRDGWEQQLAANKEAFIEAFVQRAAFRNAYDNLSNSRYVDELIGHTGVSFTQNERDELVNGLANGSLTRAGVLLRIAEDGRFVSAKRNEAFVMMEYFGYLRRDPDASGYQFWLNKLNQFDGNFEKAEMVKAFITSGEYRSRFPH